MIRPILLLILLALPLSVGSVSAQTRGNLSGADFSINSQTGAYSILAVLDGSFRIQDGQMLVTVKQGSIRLVNSDSRDTHPRSTYLTAGLAISKGRGNFWDMSKKSKRISMKKSADGEEFVLEDVTFAIPLPDNGIPLSSYWLVFQIEDSVVDSGTRLTGTYYVQSDRAIFAKL